MNQTVRPIGRLVPSWTGPARGFLIVAAMPIAATLIAFAPGDTAPQPSPWPALVVDADTAPLPVLEALPGLGQALAGRIVAARPFRSLADLDRRVKGIGPAKAAALRPFLRFPEPESAR